MRCRWNLVGAVCRCGLSRGPAVVHEKDPFTLPRTGLALRVQSPDEAGRSLAVHRRTNQHVMLSIRGAKMGPNCQSPIHRTTRGEATLARDLASAHHWDRVVVVTWRYHIPRARIVFKQCFLKRAWRSDHAARAADRSHTIRLESAITFKYQFLATAKALIQGDC